MDKKYLKLTKDDYIKLVKNAPLIAIDYLVIYKKKILLGKRNNRPAKGFWFVPGGRIKKNEKIDDAFIRILFEETMIESHRYEFSFLGVYEHFYSENAFNAPNIDTHYITLGYFKEFEKSINTSLLDQHDKQEWWGVYDALSSDLVHAFTKNYINGYIKKKYDRPIDDQ